MYNKKLQSQLTEHNTDVLQFSFRCSNVLDTVLVTVCLLSKMSAIHHGKQLMHCTHAWCNDHRALHKHTVLHSRFYNYIWLLCWKL